MGLVQIKEIECPAQSIQAFFFTKTAIELLPLIQASENEDYIRQFAKQIKSTKLIMKFGRKQILSDGQIVLKNTIDIE